MRVRFERAEDILREEKAVDLFLRGREDLGYKGLGPHDVDFRIYRKLEPNETVAFIEVKGVKKVDSVHDRHTPVVAIKKLVTLQKMINERDCENVYIAWAYSDGIKYARVQDLKGKLTWGGQKTRRHGSYYDHELMFIATETQFTIKTYV